MAKVRQSLSKRFGYASGMPSSRGVGKPLSATAVGDPGIYDPLAPRSHHKPVGGVSGKQYGGFGGAPASAKPATAGGFTATLPGAGGKTATVPNVQPALPVDPQYNAETGGYWRDYGNTVAGLDLGRQQTFTDYGYTPTIDNGTDLVTGYTFDPNNPFSRAALLKKHFDEQRAGDTTSMAAQGQLYSGAFVNRKNYTDFQDLQGTDALQKGIANFIGTNNLGHGTAGTTLATNLGNANAGRVGRAQTNPNYHPAPTKTTLVNKKTGKKIQVDGGYKYNPDEWSVAKHQLTQDGKSTVVKGAKKPAAKPAAGKPDPNRITLVNKKTGKKVTVGKNEIYDPLKFTKAKHPLTSGGKSTIKKRK